MPTVRELLILNDYDPAYNGGKGYAIVTSEENGLKAKFGLASAVREEDGTVHNSAELGELDLTTRIKSRLKAERTNVQTPDTEIAALRDLQAAKLQFKTQHNLS